MEESPQDSGLGNLIDVFAPKLSRIIAGFSLSALLVVGGAAAIGLPLHAAYVARWELPVVGQNTLTWSGVGVLCVIGVGLNAGGFILAVYCRRLASHKVELYANGFRHFSKVSADVVMWADVSHVTDALYFDLMRPRLVTYLTTTVVTVSGKEYEVSSMHLEAIDGYRSALWERAASLSLPWETIEVRGRDRVTVKAGVQHDRLALHGVSDPAQRDLDELLPGLSRIRAVVMPTKAPYAVFPIPGRVRPFPGGGIATTGDPNHVEVLIDTVDPEAIAAFRKTLRIVESSSSFGRCSCLGCPTVELYSGDKLLTTIGIQHGQAICWDRWKYAAELSDDQAVNGWLMTHGVQPALVDVLNHTAMMGFVPGNGPSGKCRYLRG